MQTDQTLTKEDILWERLRHLGEFNSHTVREIGFSMFYDRADRTVRDWASRGLLRRIPHEECLLRGLIKKGNAPLAWWEFIA